VLNKKKSVSVLQRLFETFSAKINVTLEMRSETRRHCHVRCPLFLTEFGEYCYILVKLPMMKFHENLFIYFRVGWYMRTDRHGGS
jgi:hypothetical protein